MDMDAKKIGIANKATVLLLALGALICGMLPLLAVERLVPLVKSLYVLLLSIYIALFASFCAILAGGWLLRHFSRLVAGRSVLRVLLLVDAVIVTGYWHYNLNPMPVKPLLAGGMHIPLLTLGLVMLLAWVPFLFVLKKIL
jgi:hypothetical protein